MSITVAVRVRPFNKSEKNEGAECIVSMRGHETIITPDSTNDENAQTFLTDLTYWSIPDMPSSNAFASQEVVFNDLGSLLLKHMFDGYNSCLFAYGQTSSGKTYSMMGSDDNPGVIPRMCRAIFEGIAGLLDGTVVSVEVSYLEIYCEKVRCLLNPNADTLEENAPGLKVREHPVTGSYVENLAQLVVCSEKEILKLMSDGHQIRTTAATDMNAVSSRSHAVFTAIVTQTCKVEGPNGVEVTNKKTSKLNFVDLAGSERISKTHATGKRLLEGANINKSLTTLGLVISKLSDCPSKHSHIPYREAVLTWMLKEALGGNSKTVMLATVSPAGIHIEETLSTLRYAERAKKIVNKAVVNEDSTNKMITEMQRDIDRLREQLLQQHSHEETQELQADLQQSQSLMQHMRMSWEEKRIETVHIMEEREQKINLLLTTLKEKEEHITNLEEEVSVYKKVCEHSESKLQSYEAQIEELKVKLYANSAGNNSQNSSGNIAQTQIASNSQNIARSAVLEAMPSSDEEKMLLKRQLESLSVQMGRLRRKCGRRCAITERCSVTDSRAINPERRYSSTHRSLVSRSHSYGTTSWQGTSH